MKIYFKYVQVVLLTFLATSLLNVIFFNNICGGDFFGLRNNGTGWFRFGDSLISSCNCYSIRIIYNERDSDLVVTDAKIIEKIKEWINHQKFVERANYSPFWPDYRLHDRVSVPGITLYSSKRGEFVDEIITLPLTPLAMGLTQNQCEAKKEELKNLLQSN